MVSDGPLFAYRALKRDGTLAPPRRDAAHRFMTLVDALYEHRVNLICAAEAPPRELYSEGTGAFEFRRTVSRLIEMQAADYMAQAHLV